MLTCLNYSKISYVELAKATKVIDFSQTDKQLLKLCIKSILVIRAQTNVSERLKHIFKSTDEKNKIPEKRLNCAKEYWAGAFFSPLLSSELFITDLQQMTKNKIKRFQMVPNVKVEVRIHTNQFWSACK